MDKLEKLIKKRMIIIAKKHNFKITKIDFAEDYGYVDGYGVGIIDNDIKIVLIPVYLAEENQIETIDGIIFHELLHFEFPNKTESEIDFLSRNFAKSLHDEFFQIRKNVEIDKP